MCTVSRSREGQFSVWWGHLCLYQDGFPCIQPYGCQVIDTTNKSASSQTALFPLSSVKEARGVWWQNTPVSAIEYPNGRSRGLHAVAMAGTAPSTMAATNPTSPVGGRICPRAPFVNDLTIAFWAAIARRVVRLAGFTRSPIMLPMPTGAQPRGDTSPQCLRGMRSNSSICH